MTIEAILIDLDDTLVVEVASAEAAFLATCALAKEAYGTDPAALCQTVRGAARKLWYRAPARPYAVAVGISSWEALWARFEGDDPSLQVLRDWAPTYRRESWTRALAEHGIDDPSLTERLAERFPVERRALHVVYPDVEPALRALQGTYRLALITNGASDLQREKLSGAGLEAYFDTVVIAGDVGVAKPAPRPFAIALDRLGVSARQAVMVGNSLRSDVGGAQAAGIRAIWVNRAGQEVDGEVEPDAQITDLSELGQALSLIEGL
jgi:putative hydrolase of the HAD superfamily